MFLLLSGLGGAAAVTRRMCPGGGVMSCGRPYPDNPLLSRCSPPCPAVVGPWV